jgi:hypothetical protein
LAIARGTAVGSPCSFGLSATLTVLFSQNKSVIINQSAVLFSQNKPVPAIRLCLVFFTFLTTECTPSVLKKMTFKQGFGQTLKI